MQTHSQKKLLIISGLFLLFSVGVFVFLYIKINSNNIKGDALYTEWQVEDERRSKLNSLDMLIKRIEGDRAELESHFAKSTDIVPFLDTIDSLGKMAGAEVVVSSVDILADKSGLMVSLSAKGGFNSVYAFLLLLENSPYEMSFISTNLRTDNDGEEEGTPQWTATFKLKLISFIL